MTVIYAEKALLADRWHKDVHVHIDSAGRICDVAIGHPKGDKNADVKTASPIHVSCLLPAPANAHSHAFQRAMAGLTERRSGTTQDSFWSWRDLMFRFLDQLTPDHIEAIAAFVQMEMMEAGYATNVEFHYVHHNPDGTAYDNPAEMSDRIMAAASQSGIGLTLLPVLYQFGGCDLRPLVRGQNRFHNNLDDFARLIDLVQTSVAKLNPDAQFGIAAHSLRAVAPDSIAAIRAMAASRPFHMHVAEQRAEIDEVKAALGARPVEWLLDNTDIDETCCLIHCTQMLADETERLARSGAVAGLCPITESSLGDGIFDGVNWIAAGGQIAIGSDSNIRISLAEEMRTLEYSQRLRDQSRAALADHDRSCGRFIFDAINTGGALAAGRKTGIIATGYWADLMALDDDAIHLVGRDGDYLIDSFVFAGDDRLISDVWAAGRHMVQNGQHIDHARITANYRTVLAALSDVI